MEAQKSENNIILTADQLTISVVNLRKEISPGNDSTGTGSFISKNDEIYIVTATHVSKNMDDSAYVIIQGENNLPIKIELKKLYSRIKELGYSLSLSEKAKAYVAEKGFDRQFGARPLKRAIQKTYNNEPENISPELLYLLQDKTTSEIDNYDVQLIKYLSIGISQENIEAEFKKEGISPNSKSSIEKHINKLKIYFKANNTVHLVAIAKDLGII